MNEDMQTIHKETIFASCVKECKEAAKNILKRLKKEDKELQILIFEVILD